MPPTLKQLARTHGDYTANHDRWRRLAALVDGGASLTDDIKRELLANPDNRPPAVVTERLKVARYCNKIGPIINRFLSQLFASPPQYEGSRDKWWADNFFKSGGLLPGDDGRCGFNAFLRAAMLQALTTQRAIAQIDTGIADGVLTLAEQRRAKTNEPYVVLIPRWDLWDWQTDRNGFSFAKLHKFGWVRDTWDADPVAEHDFTIYQRQPDGRIWASRYSIRVKGQGQDFDRGVIDENLDRVDERQAEIGVVNGLEEREIFNLKGKFGFPVVSLTLPNALAVADQLYDPAISDFNQGASLEYGLITSNWSMPAITSSDLDDFTSRNSRMGDGFYLHLNPDNKDAIAWLERPSGAFETAINYKDKIQTEIDRTVQSIALNAADAVTTKSGEAIRQARKPEQILLGTYGALAKEFGMSVLSVASIARGEDVQWKVLGLDDFEDLDLTSAAQEYQTVQQAAIPSPTFAKECQKSFIREASKQKGFESQQLKKMLDEVDKAPAAAPPGQPPDGPTPPQSDDDPPDTGGDPDEALADDMLSDPKLLAKLGV